MAGKKPKVSVIISCYNHEAYIEDCIDSVLKQTFRDFELLVFDDGSRDQSPRILQQLSEKHGFYFHAQENMGYCPTLNKAIAQAAGEYIAILGSDDMFLPDKLEKQVAFMDSRPDIAVCGGNILSMDGKGQILTKQRLQPYHEMDFDQLFADRKLAPPAPTALMRTAIVREVGGYDPDIKLEDLYLWFKLTSRGHRIAVLNDVLVYYREHETNTHKNYRYMIESICQTYDLYPDHRDYARVKNRYLIGSFLRVAKRNRSYALELLKQIDPSFYNFKVLRGLFHCLLSKPQSD